MKKLYVEWRELTGFRLLSELYSLLLFLSSFCYILSLLIGFRLLSELYSLLFIP